MQWLPIYNVGHDTVLSGCENDVTLRVFMVGRT